METGDLVGEVLAPTAMPLERIEAEITELAGHLAAAECRWLLLVAEFDDRLGYEQWGSRTCAHWLSWHCGLDLRAAREKLRVGHALAALPRIREEFAAGRLSYSKVRALTRVATPANEADLVMLAAFATAAQVERAVRAYRGVLSEEEELAQANERHEARYLRCDWDDDGMLAVNGRMPADLGAILLQAIEVVRRSGAATNNADALHLMAENVLVSGPHARKGNERHLVVVNVDADVLAGAGGSAGVGGGADGADGDEGNEGMCEVDGGPAIPPETARRLACDASIAWMLEDETGRARNVSARAPSIPRALRRAVHRRDRGCGFLGCGETHFTDIHHIRHRVHGGLNELWNLVELCWFHHRLVHEGGWKLFRGIDGVLRVVDPKGEILGAPALPAGSLAAVVQSNRSRGVDVAASTSVAKWTGEPLHLDHVVASLWSVDHRGN